MLLIKNIFIKRWRKTEKGAFHPDLKRRERGGSSFTLLLFAEILLQMTYAYANTRFSLNFSYFLK